MYKAIIKAAISSKCRFIILSLIIVVPSASATSASNINYNVSLSPYMQRLDFKESHSQNNFNQETGMVNGANVLFNISPNFWRLEFGANYGKGMLDYYGKSQLGRTVESTTLHEDKMYHLLLARDLYGFESSSCASCGVIEGFIAGKYLKTKRIISSRGNISGLHETYTIPMIELGILWELTGLCFFDVKVKASRAEAINARLKIDFQSNYDNSQIPLNAVFVNEIEISLGYSFSDSFNISLLLGYSQTTIEKSDKFPLYLNKEVVGEFYQPQRVRQSKTFGIKFDFKY
jgi:hypothetical protein